MLQFFSFPAHVCCFISDPTALSSDTFLSEQRGHLLLLRQNSLLLLQRLIAIGNTASNKDDNQESDEVARMKMYRLEITSYIIGSCCSSIVKSGKIILRNLFVIKYFYIPAQFYNILKV